MVSPRDGLQLLGHGDERGTVLVSSQNLYKARYWLDSEGSQCWLYLFLPKQTIYSSG